MVVANVTIVMSGVEYERKQMRYKFCGTNSAVYLGATNLVYIELQFHDIVLASRKNSTAFNPF
jgi:hypothetical protein